MYKKSTRMWMGSRTWDVLEGWRLELPAGSFLYTQKSGGQSFLLEGCRLELTVGSILCEFEKN